MAINRDQQLMMQVKQESAQPHARQRGAALLTAILVVTVATVLATNLLWISTLDQRRTAAVLASDQGLQYVLGAEAWVGDILRQDLEDSPDSDHLGEFWATEIDPLPIEGGFIVGRVSDMQGLLNLNNLVTPDGEEDELMVAQFERLLAVLGLQTSLAGAVVDWIDPGVEPRFPYGGEDDAYLRAEPQYRVANGMITTASELMAVTGFDSEIYEQVAPFVTALPRGTTLNVNTAPAEVLASLSDEIDMSVAASLLTERGDAAFANVEASFQGLVSEEMLPRIDGVSDHFLLTGEVTIGDTQLTISAVLQRDTSGITRTLFRSFGRQ
jgi:general secretion pathway protein K